MLRSANTTKELICYHCGDHCINEAINTTDKIFCCEGCKIVYQLLNEYDLCTYYTLNDNPGINQRVKVREDKFAFLDSRKVQDQLINFKNEKQTHLTFYLPQMHCSSCLYVLENLHRFEKGILSSKVNFTRKEVDVILLTGETTLRKLAETLTAIGYEPYISLNDLKEKRPALNKSMIYQLGVAGFCFGNIMLMSFPEYLGIDASDIVLRNTFRWLNFGLAIPVLLFSSLPFFESSWKGLKHKFLNIDTPIALAILITFIRSAYEVIAGTGAGYFDSMSGIVFFMLAGRILQDKTYRQLSFDRDYNSYLPVSVSVLKDNTEVPVILPDIKPGDTLLIHNEELIPTDGILTRGKAFIDYGFVTGESLPVLKEVGEIVYAGGKQTAGNIELLVVKEVSQSYLTKLWNNDTQPGESAYSNTRRDSSSFVHRLSRYFTYVVLTIAFVTGIYWSIMDESRIWPAVTSIFIIACPCALLLANSFTNGNVLRILGRNGFFLKNAETIESIAKADHIVFDKTGTLTTTQQHNIHYDGTRLTAYQQEQVAALAACSFHPLSKAIAKHLSGNNRKLEVKGFKEIIGKGIEGFVEGELVQLGSALFFNLHQKDINKTHVLVGFENKVFGSYLFSNQYRQNIPFLIRQLKNQYPLSVISGDNEAEKENLRHLFGNNTILLFNQKPEDKLMHIQYLQNTGKNVLMIGDGLNDAVAFKQADTAIAIIEPQNNFTPASDAIIKAEKLPLLLKIIQLCRANRKIVIASFILSIVYNITGLFFAVQGNLSPLVAAILMPASSLSILLITYGSSNWIGKRLLKKTIKSPNY